MSSEAPPDPNFRQDNIPMDIDYRYNFRFLQAHVNVGTALLGEPEFARPRGDIDSAVARNLYDRLNNLSNDGHYLEEEAKERPNDAELRTRMQQLNQQFRTLYDEIEKTFNLKANERVAQAVA